MPLPLPPFVSFVHPNSNPPCTFAAYNLQLLCPPKANPKPPTPSCSETPPTNHIPAASFNPSLTSEIFLLFVPSLMYRYVVIPKREEVVSPHHTLQDSSIPFLPKHTFPS